MRIEDLDEFQGLTPQMVREWLREQGFDMRIGGLLHAGRYLVEWEPIESAWRSTEASLYAVAQYRNQSVQSLLREINAELRAEEAKAAQTVVDRLIEDADARVARMTAAIVLKPVPASVQALVSAQPLKVKPRSKRGQRRAGR